MSQRVNNTAIESIDAEALPNIARFIENSMDSTSNLCYCVCHDVACIEADLVRKRLKQPAMASTSKCLHNNNNKLSRVPTTVRSLEDLRRLYSYSNSNFSARTKDLTAKQQAANSLPSSHDVATCVAVNSKLKSASGGVLSEFDNFNHLSFFKQCSLVTDWFKSMDEDRKNSLLTMLLDHCGPIQNHLFTLKLSQNECLPNYCDMINYLPKIISNQIFSYLDPVSLAKASQVCKSWHEMANDPLLWKKKCYINQWRFSSETEEAQLKRFTRSDKTVEWKSIFAEKYRVKTNWLTGKCHVTTFYGDDCVVSCVQFDQTRIVAGSGDGTIKVWNVQLLPGHSLPTNKTQSTSPYLNLFGHSGTIRCIILDSARNRLFSGSADNTIKSWDLSEVHPTWSRVACKMTFLGHSDTVRCLHQNGAILISGSYDKTLKIWDIKTGACTNTLKGHNGEVLCVQFNEEKIISGSADRSIRIWNFDGTCRRVLEGHTGSVTCIHFDSRRIISGSLDFDIKVWDMSTCECINTLNWITKEGHTRAIRCLKADNQKIVSCSDDKTIKIWNIETGERYVTLKNDDGITCLQFNDYYILSGSYDRTIKLWDFSIC